MKNRNNIILNYKMNRIKMNLQMNYKNNNQYKIKINKNN